MRKVSFLHRALSSVRVSNQVFSTAVSSSNGCCTRRLRPERSCSVHRCPAGDQRSWPAILFRSHNLLNQVRPHCHAEIVIILLVTKTSRHPAAFTEEVATSKPISRNSTSVGAAHPIVFCWQCAWKNISTQLETANIEYFYRSSA